MYTFIPLQLVAIVLGALTIATRLPGVLYPEPFRKFWLAFPRSRAAGCVTMGIAMAWCAGIVYATGFIEVIKPGTLWVWPVMAAIYALLVWLMDDFLAVRGLAFIGLLVARVILDAAFDVGTQWRLVMTVLAYVMIVAAMVFTVSPWRLRDILEYMLANNSRCRVWCGVGIAVGAAFIALGVWAY